MTRRIVDCSILIVDDEEANLDLLEGLLLSDGYDRIVRLGDGREVAATVDSCSPDLILLDLHMPFRNGFDVLKDLGEKLTADDYLPVLVLTADVTSESRDRALSQGARDFLTKPFDAVEVLLRVRNLLDTKMLHDQQREARRAAEAAERRSRLLADASRVLSSSLDSDTGLAQLAALLVRDAAGSCSILLKDSDGYRVAASAGAKSRELNEMSAAIEGALGGSIGESSFARDGLLIVPVSTAARTIGALLVTPGGTHQEFDLSEEATFRDIASRTALAIENARLFADAELASRARERMLSVVAHDLRNPLAVVAMYAEMLLGLHPPEGDRYAAEALASIYKSTHRMQQQIEDLLDISRLQHGSFAVSPAECCAAELFEEANLLLRPLADSRQIELQLHPLPEPSEATQVVIDGTRFQQVVSNLVGNALKFTPEGGRVTIEWEIDREELHVRVIDTGPGIAKAQLPHVFGAFWQARDGDRRGIGLGLWIARAIVEGHGGRIWVDSVEGEGATFHFVLPTRAQVVAAAEDNSSVGRMTHDPLALPV